MITQNEIENESEELVCSACGEKVNPNDTRCPKCGAEFGEEDEQIEKSEIPRWLWYIYPIFMLIISYLSNINNFKVGDFWYNVGRMLGAAIFYTILPLIIIAIRRLFTKKKLSHKIKFILFYGVGLAFFLLIMFGRFVQYVKH